MILRALLSQRTKQRLQQKEQDLTPWLAAGKNDRNVNFTKTDFLNEPSFYIVESCAIEKFLLVLK